jgi:hypothetical protein
VSVTLSPPGHARLGAGHQIADVGARQLGRGRPVPRTQRRLGDAAVGGRLLDDAGGERDGNRGLALALIHPAMVDAHAVVEPLRGDGAGGVRDRLHDRAGPRQRGQQRAGRRQVGRLVRLHVHRGTAERDQLGLARHAVPGRQLGDEQRARRVEGLSEGVRHLAHRDARQQPLEEGQRLGGGHRRAPA